MRGQVEERLGQLRNEFKAGQEIQSDLENRLANVRTTLVRISGAIQILEELLKQDGPMPLSTEVAAETTSAAIA